MGIVSVLRRVGEDMIEVIIDILGFEKVAGVGFIIVLTSIQIKKYC